MKRLGLFFGLMMLVAMGTATYSDAGILDSPHNSSNAMACASCHNLAPWYWPGGVIPTTFANETRDPGDLDNTVANWVCRNCHGTEANDVYDVTRNVDGPDVLLHASSSTQGDHGTWSTECVDCHVPHFQGQLDWNLSDPMDLFLAVGDFASQPTANGSDTDIDFTAVNGQTGFDDPSKWIGKGDYSGGYQSDPTSTPDGSRGLLLVPNPSIPEDNYEIIAVNGSTMTVKGAMTGDWDGKTFGIVYGQLLASYIADAHGTGFKDVKFFNPDGLSGKAGGYVDESGSGTPTGLCQVCHVSTVNWKHDGSVTDAAGHNSGNSPCKACHTHDGGFKGGGAVHDFIVDDQSTDLAQNCSDCHDAYVTAPDSAHTNSCPSCHTASPPEINTNPMPPAGDVADDDTGNPADNLVAAGYVLGTHNVDIKCGFCHNVKPAALTAVTHPPGHPEDFSWDGNCADCHSATPGAPTESVLLDIHGNGTAATCSICHNGSPSNTSEWVGDPANGEDALGIIDSVTVGAAGVWANVTCTTCHVVTGYGAATIHHDNATVIVADGLTDDGTICATCHGTAGHEGNHSTTVAIADPNCIDCHAGTAGTSTTVPLGAAKLHDTCGTCHTINSNIVDLVAPAGLATGINNGGEAGGTNGGGTCITCHTDTFVNYHTALTKDVAGVVDHSGMVSLDALNCAAACHDMTAAPAGGAVPLGGAKLHDDCITCHDSATGRLVNSAAGHNGAGDGGSDGGGNCTVCHGAYFDNHNAVDHSATVANVTGECDNCHTATHGNPTITVDGTPGNLVHDACTTCHATDGLLKSGVIGSANIPAATTDGGKDDGGNCTACHGSYFTNHNHTHTGIGTTDLCISCHTGPDHLADTHNANCANCHNLTTGARVDGSVNATSFGTPTGTDQNVGDASGDYGSGAGEGGTCQDCHAAYYEGHLHQHDAFGPTTGTTRQTCGTTDCHLVTTTPYIGAGEVHEITSGGDGCFACHSAVDGSRISVAAGNDGATDCLDCHTGKFDNHNGRDTAHDVLMSTAGQVDEITSTGQACNDCHGNFVNTWPDIITLHVGSCGTCHDASSTDLSPTYAPGTVQDVIQTDSVTIGCLDCHYSRRNVHMDHLAYDNGGAYVPAGVILEDATRCTTCHTGGGTTGALTDGNMMSIHDYSGGGCGTCHVSATGGGPLKAPYTGLYGDCTTCHTTYTDFAAGHQNVVQPHAGITATGAADCVSCHSGDTTGVSGVHTLTQTCNNCHTDSATNGTLVSFATTALPISKEGGADKACIDCHTTQDGDFSAHTADTHLARVTATSNGTCETCHTAPVLTEHTSQCDLCHVAADNNGTDGTLQGSAVNHTVFQVSTCVTCHMTGTNAGVTWQSKHETSTMVDHSTQVANLATCTDSCHTSTGNQTEPANLVDGVDGNKVHDACLSCHDADGQRLTGIVIPGSNVTDIPAGGGNCATCHDTQTFETHTHHTVNNGVVYAVDGLDANAGTTGDNDTSQADSAGCASAAGCHDNAGQLADFVANILPVHNSACATCHSYDGSNGTYNTIPVGDVTGAIAAGTASCDTCHEAKTPSTTHGVHTEGDGTLTPALGEDPCGACHGIGSLNANAPYGEVTADIHSDNCALCHTGGVGGAQPPAGSATNAWVAGAWTAKPHTCTECHTAYFGDATGGHGHGHDIANDAGTCDQCHNLDNSDGSSAANAIAAPYVQAGEVHATNACATCHNLSTPNDGSLVTRAASANPGGDSIYQCSECHTESWISIHQASTGVDHASTRVYDSVNCNGCHNGASTPGFKVLTSPFEGPDEVHAAGGGCTTCHTGAGDGAVRSSGLAKADTITPGDCTLCHTVTSTWTTIHTGTAHGFTVSAGCSDCHNVDKTDGNAGNAVNGNGPWTNADEVHAAGCTLCHDANGGLVGLAIGKTMAAECTTCHTDTWTVIHTGDLGTGPAFVDHSSLVTDSGNCDTCHTSTVPPYRTGVEVHGNSDCATCHTASGGIISPAPAIAGGLSAAGGNCEFCHNQGWPGTHGDSAKVDHSQEVAALAGCTDSCHTTTVAVMPNDMVDGLDGTDVHDACDLCHNTTNGTLLAVTAPAGSDTINVLAPNGGTCALCHDNQTFETHTHGNDGNHNVNYNASVDDSQVSMAGLNPCADCHTVPAANSVISATVHEAGCGVCHSYATANDGLETPPVADVTGAISGGGATACTVCHTPKLDPAPTSDHGNPHPTNDFTDTASCMTCHSGANVVMDVHGGVCTTCHSSAAGTRNNEKVGDNGDGDATTADGTAAAGGAAWQAVTCLTCHDVNDPDVTPATIGGIHHNNTGSVSYDTNACADCHANADHSALVADAAGDCNGCHTLTPASAGSAPVVSAGDNKVHDACTTCHQIAAGPDYDGQLASGPFGMGVTTMNDPSTPPSDNAGGNCVQCHTTMSTRTASATVHHGTTLASGVARCDICHVNDYDNTGVGGTSGTGTADTKQLACLECHVNISAGDMTIDSLSLADAHDASTTVTQNFIKTNATNVTTHDFTGSGITAIYDLRSCFACHNGSDTGGAVAAPVVAPFHGYDNVWDGTEDIQHLNNTGKNWATASNNVNNFPIVFAYQHPGHNSFRRFANANNMNGTGNCRGDGPFETAGESHYRNKSPATIGGVSWTDYVGGDEGGYTGGLGHPCGTGFVTTPGAPYNQRITSIPYNQFGAGGGPFTDVPVFANLTSENDSVVAVSCVVDQNGDLTVVASNTEGCAALDFTTQTDGTNRGGMTSIGGGYCEGTVASVSPIPTSVDVTGGTGNPTDNVVCIDNSNAIPVANTDNFNTGWNGTINDDVSTNDDLGDTPSTFALDTDVPGGEGTLTFNSDGTFTYQAGTSFTGNTSFTYTITDATPDTSAPGTVNITVANLTPTAVNDDITAAAGLVYNGDVSADNGNGLDTLGDTPATFAADTTGLQGTLTSFNTNTGAFSYDPGAFTGNTSFTYTITDANSDVSNTATVSILVAVVPVAVADTYNVNEGTLLDDDVSTNDTPGDPVNTWTLVADVPGGEGTLTLNANGTFQYNSGSFCGATSFTYKIVDGLAPTDSETVAADINVNCLPTPADDSFSTPVDTQLVGDVTTNDDLGDGLGTVNLVTDVSNGTLVLNTDGSFTYDPTPAWSGTDTFVYSITDTTPDTSTTNATVTITVSADQVVSGWAQWTPGTGGVNYDNTEIFDGLGLVDQVTTFGSGTDSLNSPTMDDQVTWSGTFNEGGMATDWIIDTTSPSAAGPNDTECGATPGSCDEYIFTEHSQTKPSTCELTTSNLDASTNTYDLTFKYHAGIARAGHGLLVQINDGAGWTTVQTVIDTATSTVGSRNDPWTTVGPIALGGSSATMQARIQYIVPDTTNWDNDMAIDDLQITENGAPTSATIDVKAANTVTDAGANLVATYNGVPYPMTQVTPGASTQWQIVGATDTNNTYVNSMTITSTGDATGITIPVEDCTGGCTAVDWPTIAVTGATWYPTPDEHVVVTATTTWNDQDTLFVDYDGSGPTEMTWNVGGYWEHTFTGYPTFVAGNASVTSHAASNSPQQLAVVDSTANDAPVIGTPPADFAINTDATKADIEVTSTVTDTENDQIRVLSASATCGTINTVTPTAFQNIGQPTNLSYTAPATPGSCTISYTVEDAFGGTFNDTIVATVSAPPACGTLASTNWNQHITGTTIPTNAGAYTSTYAADTSRLLVVGVYGYNGTPGTGNITNVALGAAGFTSIYNNNGSNTRNHAWVGYMGETDLAANDGSNITMSTTFTSTSSAVLTKEFQWVSQNDPIPASASDENPSGTGSTLATTAISYGANDMLIGLGANRDGGTTWGAPAVMTEEATGGTTYSAAATPTYGTGGSTNFTDTVSGRYSFIVGATVQSCTNNP